MPKRKANDMTCRCDDGSLACKVRELAAGRPIVEGVTCLNEAMPDVFACDEHETVWKDTREGKVEGR